ncbi:MAG: YbjN domain-containing protein [Deltaproteobacteria bacterium]|nr:YbjN domain-containing protein [Deltaproteobacteria bacterium]MBN2671389.1 YbjN domain-containing protein [Deltaproteobacteria bacterium]
MNRRICVLVSLVIFIVGCGGARLQESLDSCQQKLVETSKECNHAPPECPPPQECSKNSSVIGDILASTPQTCPRCERVECPAVDNTPVIYGLDTPDLISIILRGGGLSPEEIKPGVIRFTLNNANVVVFNKDGILHLFCGFEEKDIKESLVKALSWNKSKRFSRSYVDPDNESIVIESELYITKGVTMATIQHWFDTYKVSLEEFIREEL